MSLGLKRRFNINFPVTFIATVNVHQCVEQEQFLRRRSIDINANTESIEKELKRTKKSIKIITVVHLEVDFVI